VTHSSEHTSYFERLKNLNNNNNIAISDVPIALIVLSDVSSTQYKTWDEKSIRYKYGGRTAVIDLVTRSAAEVCRIPNNIVHKVHIAGQSSLSFSIPFSSVLHRPSYSSRSFLFSSTFLPYPAYSGPSISRKLTSKYFACSRFRMPAV